MKEAKFTNLELQDSVRQLLKSWSKLFRCSNVHWISKDTLDRISITDSNVWKWTVDTEQNVESLRPALLDSLFGVWKIVSQMEFFNGLKQPKHFTLDGKIYVLAPIAGPQFSHVMGYFLFEDVKKKPGARQMRQLRNAIKSCSTHVEFCWQYWLSKQESFMDDLTSLYNQRYMPVVFEREIARMERLQKKFSVLFMDIDYFKQVNDTRGHWIGSRLLIEVAKIIKACTRTCDYSFRYGGDEFVIVLVDTSPENGQIVAERIRAAIEREQFLVEGHDVKLTVSIGLAAYPDHAKSTVELINLADQAMYYGKHKSRNIVFLAG